MFCDYEFKLGEGGRGELTGEGEGMGRIKQLFWKNELDRYELEI